MKSSSCQKWQDFCLSHGRVIFLYIYIASSLSIPLLADTEVVREKGSGCLSSFCLKNCSDISEFIRKGLVYGWSRCEISETHFWDSKLGRLTSSRENTFLAPKCRVHMTNDSTSWICRQLVVRLPLMASIFQLQSPNNFLQSKETDSDK